MPGVATDARVEPEHDGTTPGHDGTTPGHDGTTSGHDRASLGPDGFSAFTGAGAMPARRAINSSVIS
jgi:hypothetical protein